MPDNRNWLMHPEEPAIIIGTVDMIGSRLFFSGYGVSHKMRAFYAGLLGQDSLIVLDETHLSPAMMSALKDMNEISSKVKQELFPPKTMFMTATQPDKVHKNDVFTLNKTDLENDEIKKRYKAKKNIEVVKVKNGENKLDQIEAYAKKIQGRILIYLQKPKRCKEHGRQTKKRRS